MNIDDLFSFNHSNNQAHLRKDHLNLQVFEDRRDIIEHLRELNSLYHLISVIESIGRQRSYDIVVFINAKIRLLQPIPIAVLAGIANTSMILVPDVERSCRGDEINSKLAIATKTSAIYYGNQLSSLASFIYSSQSFWNREMLLNFHLSRNAVRILEIPWYYSTSTSELMVNYNVLSNNTNRGLEPIWTWKYLETKFLKQWQKVYDRIFCSPFRRISPQGLLNLEEMPTDSNSPKNRKFHTKERFYCSKMIPLKFHPSIMINRPMNCTVKMNIPSIKILQNKSSNQFILSSKYRKYLARSRRRKTMKRFTGKL